MTRSFLSLFLLSALSLNGRTGDDNISVPTSLQSAIIYPTAASLTHEAKASLKQGQNDLVLEGLSNSVDPNSIEITSDQKLTILSVVFTTDYLKTALQSPSVKKLNDSLQNLNRENVRLRTAIQTNSELLELLRANRVMKGEQTGLNLAELTKMVEYYKTRSLAIYDDIARLQEEQTQIGQQIQKVQLQIQEEERKNTKTGGRILLQVLSPISTNCRFTIRYLTTNAYWTPSYDIRVDNIRQPLNLVYKAKMVQTTGIDWKQVKLSLATSAPNQHNQMPTLKPWFLSYIQPIGMAPTALNDVVVVGYGRSTTARTDDEEETPSIKLRGQATLNQSSEPLYVVDGVPSSAKEFAGIPPQMVKNVEVLKDAQATAIYGSRGANGVVLVTLKNGMPDLASANVRELDVVYNIDLPYDLAATGKEQTVILKQQEVPAHSKYYAYPETGRDAFLASEITNWGSLNLLAGQANIIYEGTYTGKTNIDPNSVKDTLQLTIGKDKRLLVQKELVKDFSSVKFLGSNKKQVFTYEITVRNNRKDSINITIRDQFPLSMNKEIEVELLESSGAVVDNEKGLLEWNLAMNAGESRKLRFSYSIRYPKDKIVK